MRGALIEGAIKHKGQPLYDPIDRNKPAGKPFGAQIEEMVPRRYNEAKSGVPFNWMYEIANYHHVYDVNELKPVAITLTPPPVTPEKPKIGLLESLAVRVGAQSTFLFNEFYGSLRGIVGLDTKAQKEAMKQAQEVLQEVKYESDDPLVNMAGQALGMMETIGMGFFEWPIERINAALRVAALGKAVATESMEYLGAAAGLTGEDPDFKVEIPDVPGLEALKTTMENGGTIGDVLEKVTVDAISVTPAGAGIIGAITLAESAKNGDINGMLSGGVAAMLGRASAMRNMQEFQGAMGSALHAAKTAPATARAAMAELKKTRQKAQQAMQESIRYTKEMNKKHKKLAPAKDGSDKGISNERTIDQGHNGEAPPSPPRFIGTALLKSQLSEKLWEKGEPVSNFKDAVARAIENQAFVLWGLGQGANNQSADQEVLNLTAAEKSAYSKSIAKSKSAPNKIAKDDIVAIKMKNNPNGVVGMEGKTIYIVLQDSGFFKDNGYLKIANVTDPNDILAGYEIPRNPDSKKRVNFDLLKNPSNSIAIYVNKSMMQNEEGLMVALAHEVSELSFVFKELSDPKYKVKANQIRYSTFVKAQHAGHEHAISAADISYKQYIDLINGIYDSEKVQKGFDDFLEEYEVIHKKMGSLHEKALEKKYTNEDNLVLGETLLKEVEYQIYEIGANGQPESTPLKLKTFDGDLISNGRFDFLKINIENDQATSIKIIEAKSKATPLDAKNSDGKDFLTKNDTFYLYKSTLTENQQILYPILLSNKNIAVKLVESSLKKNGSATLTTLKQSGVIDEQGFFKNLDLNSIQFERRLYFRDSLNKINLSSVEEGTPLDVNLERLLLNARNDTQKAINAILKEIPDKSPQLQQVDVNGSQHEPLTNNLEPIIEVARQYWQSLGVPAELLENVMINLDDLANVEIGRVENRQITIDADGTGWGWFVDPTPQESSEFNFNSTGDEGIALAGTEAANKLDLLSVLIHEMGHILGLADNDTPQDVMNGFTTTGLRRLPTLEDVQQVLDNLEAMIDGGFTGTPLTVSGVTRVTPPQHIVYQAPASANNTLVTLIEKQRCMATNEWRIV